MISFGYFTSIYGTITVILNNIKRTREQMNNIDSDKKAP